MESYWIFDWISIGLLAAAFPSCSTARQWPSKAEVLQAIPKDRHGVVGGVKLILCNFHNLVYIYWYFLVGGLEMFGTFLEISIDWE